ncbi:hypothetical protein [Tenacibaculum litopenaei]|uniref:hypothetical protein n=1 Tax=Tenacibaculum litopenaei TaxID=396016 RepID=UPI0038B4F8CE
MNKNELIKGNLEYHLDNSVKSLKGDFSYLKLLEREFISLEETKWFADPEFDIEC